jgi:hypothetical protein
VDLGLPFEVRFSVQSPEATLSNTQGSTLEQLMHSITENKGLDKEKKRLYPIARLKNPGHNEPMNMFLH